MVSPALLAQRTRADTAYKQPFRPQFHFSPRVNWTNDPNGLVYYNGEYHLFYQYNPFGIRWGHMTWGHAVSRDLLHWRELPPAIPEEGPTMIFSGSCVVDKDNTSGFGRNGAVPMVAVYTGQQTGRQNQHLAYSLDKGRTWTKYAGNPVLDLGQKDFRDPKVFWHQPTQRWVMVVLLPTEKKVLFYTSPDLKQWAKTGEFTSADSPANIWECPDLVDVPVAGTPERKWLLLLSMGSNGAAGGSGMQYYVGRFDGKTFTSEQPTGRPRYVDWGKDYYAAITYNNLPGRGNRGPISVGWMNNWQYANDIPTTPFRGAMTLPRELSLVKGSSGYALRQSPIRELDGLFGDNVFRWGGTPDAKPAPAAELNQKLRTAALPNDAYLLTFTADPASATQPGDLGVRVRKGDAEETVIGYDPVKKQLYVDRSRSGQVSFSKAFPGRFSAPLDASGRHLDIWVYVDRSSVEVFTGDGQVVLTNQIFPKPDSRGIEFFGAGFRSVTIRPIESIWK